MADDPKIPEGGSIRPWAELEPEERQAAELTELDLLEWFRERWPGEPVAVSVRVVELDECAEARTGIIVEGWIPKPSSGWPQMGEAEDPSEPLAEGDGVEIEEVPEDG